MPHHPSFFDAAKPPAGMPEALEVAMKKVIIPPGLA